MKNVKIAFKVLENGDKVSPCLQKIKCQLIFDVDMEDFRIKAQIVASGHLTDTKMAMRYSSVVSRKSVRIELMLAALNNIEVKTTGI